MRVINNFMIECPHCGMQVLFGSNDTFSAQSRAETHSGVVAHMVVEHGMTLEAVVEFMLTNQLLAVAHPVT